MLTGMVLALGMSVPSGALEAESTVDGAVVRTSKLELEIAAGKIVRIRELTTGVEFGSPAGAAAGIPAGLGVFDGDAAELSRTHIQWGNLATGSLLAPQTFRQYHRPVEGSGFHCEVTPDRVVLHYRGLGGGEQFFPEETLTLTLSEADGAVAVVAAGAAPGGIFGVQLPVVGLPVASRLVLPNFGGMEYRGTGAEGIMPLGGAPFLEAPVLAAELDGAALGLWLEDDHFGPYYAFISRLNDQFSLAFEPQNLMPFEPQTSLRPVTLKITAVPGSWQQAMTPYRDWYRRKFAAELAVRDAVEWAGSIHAVIDVVGSEDAERLAAYFPPETVLCHDWNGRAPDFDTELPDWTPRAGYVEKVARLHEYGFKTMAYINTYCVNVGSRIFEREKLVDFFLTRKNAIYQYNLTRKPAEVNELLTGTIVPQLPGAGPLDGIRPGQLLYGDPLSRRWREFHAAQAAEWNRGTGTDANYEDTAGCAGDFGNGVVDGLSAGEGTVEQMRLLQKTQPQVPMASEYGPPEIAFAVKWPLNYAQVWGDDAWRRYRLHHQLPVTAFLFGYSTWVPSVAAERDFLKHTLMAVSDAAGGMGVVMGAAFEPESVGGFAGLMTLRTRIFTTKRLKPYFPPQPAGEYIRCVYRGIDGIYRYYDDGTLQQMLDPDGVPLYGRLDGAGSYAGSLTLPGWPLRRGNRLEGLDPKRSYALFPAAPEEGDAAAFEFDPLPEGVWLERYCDTPELVYCEFVCAPERMPERFRLKWQETFAEVSVNGRRCPAAGQVDLAGPYPVRIVALRQAGRPVIPGETLETAGVMVRNLGSSGIGEGEAEPLAVLHRGRFADGEERYRLDGRRVRRLDWLIKAPEENSELLFHLQNAANSHGNGTVVRLLVNGVTVNELDCRPEATTQVPWALSGAFDTDLHEWRVPLERYCGENVLITVEVDPKGDSNGDEQYISIPRLVRAGDGL